MTISSAHPLFDAQVGNLATVTYLTDPVVGWSEQLSDFVTRMRRDTDRTLILTIPADATITPAFDRFSDLTGLQVLVEDAGGYRHMRTGRRLASVRDVVENPDNPHVVISQSFLAGLSASGLEEQTVISASIHHPARRSTLVGRGVELIAHAFLGQDTTISWGRYEPVGAAWDRSALTELSRRLMPTAHFTLAAHSASGALSGTMTISRTDVGLEEYTEVHVCTSLLPVAQAAEATMELLEVIALEAKPQFIMATSVLGNADTSLPTTMRRPPTPLALLIGAPGLNLLQVHAAQVAAAHGGQVVGMGRRRGVAVPLYTGQTADWSVLTDLKTTLDASGHLDGVLRRSMPPPRPGVSYEP